MDAERLFQNAADDARREGKQMSLLDGCSPHQRVGHHTSENVKAFWDLSYHAQRRTAMLSELISMFEIGGLRPQETVCELIVKAAGRIAYREEHG